jgi:hypothetical protein
MVDVTDVSDICEIPNRSHLRCVLYNDIGAAAFANRSSVEQSVRVGVCVEEVRA